MRNDLRKRVVELEQRDGAGGRVSVCWKGSEPSDVGPGNTLYVLSWEDELDEGEQGYAA